MPIVKWDRIHGRIQRIGDTGLGSSGSSGLPSILVMSRLLCPILLTVSVAFPGAALALGLGDLHVESSLGQAFVARIDLIEASHEDLARLSAAIADADAFQRYQLVRPSFLTGTTVTLAKDDQGQPILRLRSTESFTEPVVTFLVDVHWLSGELIREYSAFLDPADLASRAAAVAPAVAVPTILAAVTQTTPIAAPAVAPAAASMQSVAMAPDHEPQTHSYTVARGDTLAGIARKAGGRSAKERHRMMIAIYRANPSAFQTNLDALRSGVSLRLPSAEELAAIAPAEAEHEYRNRFATRGHARTHKHTSRAEEPSEPAVLSAPVDAASLEADRAALAHRVESLEQSLQQMRGELQRAQQTATPRPVNAEPPAAEPPAEPSDSGNDSTPPLHRRTRYVALIIGLGLALAAGVWWALRRREEDDPRAAIQAALNSIIAEEPKQNVPVEVPSAKLPPQEPAEREDSVAAQAPARTVAPPPVSAAAPEPREPAEQVDTGETTAILGPELDAFDDTVEQKFAFYSPETHADTTHVVMGSELTRPLAFVERRKNPAVVLQQAIEREPHRNDLHLKLLELYYATASENRLAFLEATRQIMKKKDLVSAEDWARIADMGRQIAPDDELFKSDLDDQAVA